MEEYKAAQDDGYVERVFSYSTAILKSCLEQAESGEVKPKEITIATIMAAVTMAVGLGVDKEVLLKTVSQLYDCEELKGESKSE